MTAPLDAMLAELAAAELACREHHRESFRLRTLHGESSVEEFVHAKGWRALFDRKYAAERAIANYAIDWAAERAKVFLDAANEVAS